MESWNHSFKVEAIHGERFATRESMRQAVFEYIETDYNSVRLHSANDFQSPIEFEAKFKQSSLILQIAGFLRVLSVLCG